VQEGRPFWEGMGEGLRRERQDANFATVLGNAGMDEGWQRNVLGFGLDALIDPLNLLGIGVIRGAVGGVARGVGRGVGGIPVPRTGMRTAELADRMSEPIRRGTAAMFSQRFGAGSGETYWGMRRSVRNMGDKAKSAVGKLIGFDRRLRNIRRDRDKLGYEELLSSIFRARSDDLLAQGKSTREADQGAAQLIDDLHENEELVNAIGTRMIQLRDEYRPGGGGVGLVEGVPTETPARARMRREGGDSPLALIKDDIEGDYIAHGTPSLYRVASENPYEYAQLALERVGAEHGVEGIGSIARMVQSKWGRMSDGEMGELARLSEDWLGVTPVEEFYYHGYYTSQEHLNIAKKTMAGKLDDHVEDFARYHTMTAEEAIAAGAETHFLAVMARDIAQRKMAVESAKIIDPALLDDLGRRVIDTRTNPRYVLDDGKSVLKTDQESLTRLLQDVSAQGLGREGATAVLETYRRGVDLVAKEGGAARIEEVAARFGSTPEQQTAIRRLLETQPGPNEGIFHRGARGILLDDDGARRLEADFGERVTWGMVGEEASGSWILPKDIADSFNSFNEPYAMGGLLRAVDAFNGLWKPTVTVFPAFEVWPRGSQASKERPRGSAKGQCHTVEAFPRGARKGQGSRRGDSQGRRSNRSR
jgi:hypothetical protein